MLPFPYPYWKDHIKPATNTDPRAERARPDGFLMRNLKKIFGVARHSNQEHNENKPYMIQCVFCNGRGTRPHEIARKRQPGTLEHPPEQSVYSFWSYDTSSQCPVCFGHKVLPVYPDSTDDPWVPCAPCETYGRVLTREIKHYEDKAVWKISTDPCSHCQGLGFRLRSQQNTQTGQTQKL
jgi:hypothetical protein